MTESELNAKGYRIDGTRMPMQMVVTKVHKDHVEVATCPTTDEEKLNKTERAYLRYLRSMGYEPHIQAITLKLADDCRLTPDFDYLAGNGRIVMVDVKGFQREDALIKMKMAARLFRWFDFVIVKKDGSGWTEQPVKP